IDALMKLGVLVFSLSLHEFGHAYAAYRLGDPTAKMVGRMTIDPRAHVDPIGTILFPLMMFMFPSLILFGWAKPVPVTVENLRKPRRDGALVALAGPAMNLLLALLSLGVLVLLGATSAFGMEEGWANTVFGCVQFFLFMNIGLAVFNLLPIYPLDGSWILKSILPPRWSYQVSRFDRYGFIVLFVIFILLRNL
ncbi:MAG TPA: site-2 protease family protein, partial [Puia sp.]|nr:site-2 protease family protein [Puia sp.]